MAPIEHRCCSHYLCLHLYSRVIFFFMFFFFFFNDPAPTEIYTLSLHDALPIFSIAALRSVCTPTRASSSVAWRVNTLRIADRKSTRLNSSHVEISYAVFCLKKKKKKNKKKQTNINITLLLNQIIPNNYTIYIHV